MNKLVVKNNKECFDSWIAGNKVWVKNLPYSWLLTDDIHWSYPSALYTLDDEYSEFRKKICDLEQELSKLKGQVR